MKFLKRGFGGKTFFKKFSPQKHVMKIEKLTLKNVDSAAPLVAEFRATLRAFKGEIIEYAIEDGKEELLDFLDKNYPVFIAIEDEKCVGYLACRIDEPCVWVEHIFVHKEYRRRHIASALFEKAEEVAAEYGQETVYNYIHPNNDGIIAFLRSRGYNVLNLIEIRKPYSGEKPTTKINVGGNEFDY